MTALGGAAVREKPAHLKTLTAMRWGAAAMVVLPHLYMTQLPEYLRNAFEHSSIGVMFFFMLSGFVLTWSVRAGDTKRKFYQRRLARIYPLYLLTLVLSIPVIYLEGLGPSWRALPFHVTLTQSWIPFAPVYTGFNKLSWSLSCEAFFYAIFPFVIPKLMAMTVRSRRALLGGIAFLVLVKGVITQSLVGVDTQLFAGLTGEELGHWAGYYLPAVRVLEFLAGIIFALEVRDGFRVRISTVQALLIAGVIYAAVAFVGGLDLGTMDAIMFIPAGIVLLAGATRDLSGAPAPKNWLVLLGQASFAMYLVQQLILRTVIAASPDFFHQDTLAALGLAALAIVVLTAVSIPFHLWFEVPLERRLRPRGSRRPVDDPSERIDVLEEPAVAQGLRRRVRSR